MTFRLSNSVRANLLLVILAGILPIFIVILASGAELRDKELKNADEESRRICRSLASQQEAITQGVRQLLSTLAQLPEVKGLDAVRCTPIFQDLLRLNPVHSNLVLLTKDGDVICSVKPIAKANMSEFKHVADAQRTMEFSTGEFIIGPLSKVPVFSFAHPVLSPSGQLLGILATSLKLGHYYDQFELTSMPIDTAFGVLDHKGTRMAQLPISDSLKVGTSVQPLAWVEYIKHIDGHSHHTGKDGVRRYYFSRQVRLKPNSAPYMVFTVGFPESYILSKADAITRNNLLWLALASVISLGVAYFIGNRGFVQPLSALSDTTQRLALGEHTARTKLDALSGPIGMVAKSVDKLAQELQSRESARILSEQTIRESEERFRLLASESPVSIIAFDSMGTITFVSKWHLSEFAKDQLGEDYFLGRKVWDLPSMVSAGLDSQVRQVLDGKSLHLSQIYVPSNCIGDESYQNIRGVPFRKEQAVVGGVLIREDITARTRYQMELGRSEKRFRRIVETANEGIWEFTDAYKTRYVNTTMANILGYTPEEMIGRQFGDFISPDDIPSQEAEIALRKSGVSSKYERRLRRKDGGEIWCLVSASPKIDDTGKFQGSFAMFTDITERKLREQILMARSMLGKVANNQDLDAVLQATLDAAEDVTRSSIGFFHFVEPDGVTLSLQNWSTRTRRNCATPGKGLHYSIDSAGVWVDAMRQGKPVTHNDYAALDHKRGLPVGHVPVMRELVVPIYDKEQLVALIGVGNKAFDYDERDVETLNSLAGLAWEVVARKRVQDELVHSKELAESANLAKSEFLANMSHEIRTPLNGVLGMLQLLQEDISPDEKSSYAHMAYDAGRRLLSLLNDILDFSKMEAGLLEFTNEDFSPSQLLEGVAGVFSMATKEKGLEFTWAVDPSVPALLVADEGRIRQILFNLVGNAIKFTPSGSIRVEAWASHTPNTPTKTRLYISVSDTGIGIPEDKVSVMFERFTQSDASFSRKYEGAGLGLAIVKRIVDLMRGDITVDSEVGAGTTVYLVFQLDNSSHQSFGPAIASGAAAIRPMRILLADDEPIGSMSMHVMLTRLGHTVVAVADGVQALDALDEHDFDCILMDINMPEMDGVEATRIIRNDLRFSAKSSIPIIALTAYAMEGDREKFLAAGMDEHVTKPVRVGEISDAIRAVCHGSRKE